MREAPLNYSTRPPRRLFAWEHAIGAAAVTAMVVVIAFVLAPAAEETLRQQGVRIPEYVVFVLDLCRLIRRFGWMLAWAPAVTVGFVFAALGSRGRHRWLALRLWLVVGIGTGLVLGIAIYGTILRLAMDAAGGK